jgi:hypothetical protein
MQAIHTPAYRDARAERQFGSWTFTVPPPAQMPHQIVFSYGEIGMRNCTHNAIMRRSIHSSALLSALIATAGCASTPKRRLICPSSCSGGTD